jgi:hypothetical protein
MMRCHGKEFAALADEIPKGPNKEGVTAGQILPPDYCRRIEVE